MKKFTAAVCLAGLVFAAVIFGGFSSYASEPEPPPLTASESGESGTVKWVDATEKKGTVKWVESTSSEPSDGTVKWVESTSEPGDGKIKWVESTKSPNDRITWLEPPSLPSAGTTAPSVPANPPLPETLPQVAAPAKVSPKVGTKSAPYTKKALFIKYSISKDGVLTISPASAAVNPKSVYKQKNRWFANYGRVLDKDGALYRYKAPWEAKSAKIKKVVVKAGVPNVPSRLFVDLKNLQEVVFEQTALEIDGNVFLNLPKLSSVTLTRGAVISGSAAVNCPKLKPAAVGVSYTYDKTAKKLTVTPKYDVCGDNWSAFGFPWDKYKKEIKSVVIGDGITAVQARAFENCTALTSVKLPPSVSDIGGSAFAGDKKLKTVSFPKGLQNIGDKGFQYTALSVLNLKKPAPDGSGEGSVDFNLPLVVGQYAFANCAKLTKVTADSGVEINHGAFALCRKLTTVNLESGGEMYGNPFRGCTALKNENVKSDYIFAPTDSYEGDKVQRRGWSAGWGTFANYDNTDYAQVTLFIKKPDNTKTLKIFGGDSKNITWRSTNKSVATVDKNGRVKGIKEGYAVIYAKDRVTERQINFMVAVYTELQRKIMNTQASLPDGYYYNTYPAAKGYKEVSSTPCTDHTPSSLGSHDKAQCVGFAYNILYKVFGNAKHIPLKSRKDIKPGTYIRINITAYGGHSLIVYKVVKKGQVIGYDFESNKAIKAEKTAYEGADANWRRDCGISWGDTWAEFEKLNWAYSFNVY
ncbi:hypothetical protein FACS1894120_1730 [Clostridia bacterium]|nr:hypothetical protein FACS1894120_1730 [Clostridia bacterium]